MAPKKRSLQPATGPGAVDFMLKKLAILETVNIEIIAKEFAEPN
jgi:hypothetical protein